MTFRTVRVKCGRVQLVCVIEIHYTSSTDVQQHTKREIKNDDMPKYQTLLAKVTPLGLGSSRDFGCDDYGLVVL